MGRDWADKANLLYAEAKADITKLKAKLQQLRKITNDHDEVKDSANPFIMLIDKEIESLDHFMDQFESV
jgi:hypothetical protein